ncbi:MAG: hypothetical protein HY362_02360 [Candidatus Aenigmarchaeota archaeon]|nr:hypothetical protein [Candidatus Aenigmarchaeota archaeon]
MLDIELRKIIYGLILIAFVVTTVIFWQIMKLNELNNGSELKNNVAEFIQKFHTLKSAGKDSFDNITLHVPNGQHLTIDIEDTSSYISYYNGLNFTFILPAKIIKFKDKDTIYTKGKINFTNDTYKIKLYYGVLKDENIEPWTLTFE